MVSGTTYVSGSPSAYETVRNVIVVRSGRGTVAVIRKEEIWRSLPAYHRRDRSHVRSSRSRPARSRPAKTDSQGPVTGRATGSPPVAVASLLSCSRDSHTNPYGPSVSRYGRRPIGGNRVPPST